MYRFFSSLKKIAGHVYTVTSSKYKTMTLSVVKQNINKLKNNCSFSEIHSHKADGTQKNCIGHQFVCLKFIACLAYLFT